MSVNIFKELSKLEYDGKLNEVVSYSAELLSNPELLGLHQSIKLNMKRILDKVSSSIFDYWVEPIAIYELDKNPNTYVLNGNGGSPLISLTTISGRLERLKKTIQSIKKQNVEIHSINLYISETPFLLDEGIERTDPELLEIHNMGVNIYSVPNIGPYRKQIPIIYQLRKSDAQPNTPIITIDDDVLYPDDIVQRLMKGSKDAVVSHRGREMFLDKHSVGSYTKFVVPKKDVSAMNLGTGKNGILYRLGFFPRSVIGYMGPIIAPTADDLWCKWVTALNCIPTQIIEPESAFNPSLDFPESNPSDKNGLFHKFNAKGSNDIAIKHLENYYIHQFGYNFFSIYSFLGEK